MRPGERLPTDGLVLAGASAVDQSAVTGESIPVKVTAGSEVFGGTVNGTGALELRLAQRRRRGPEVLRLAAGVETASEHPLASAVLAGARDRGLSCPAAGSSRSCTSSAWSGS